MSDLTPEALDRLAQLDADATPGPWEVTRRGIESPPYSDVLTGGPVECMAYCYGGSSTLEGDNFTADAALIAAMRTHLPAFLNAAREQNAPLADDKMTWTNAQADAWHRGAQWGMSKSDTVRNLHIERDAARAELADLRERMTALASKLSDPLWERNSGSLDLPPEGVWRRARWAAGAEIRAVLDGK